MLGSDLSIAGPNIILNTIVAEELSQFADSLEAAEDFNAALEELIKKTISEHKRIIFNGNNYSEEWVKEAEKRGLLNLKTTADALPFFIADKNILLFTKHKIFTPAELRSRYEILMEVYSKKLHIEALTMVDMIRRQILPGVAKYSERLTRSVLEKKKLSPDITCDFEEDAVKKLSGYASALYRAAEKLNADLERAAAIGEVTEQAMFYKDVILADMAQAREAADHAEQLTAKEYWPYPCYADLLYSV